MKGLSLRVFGPRLSPAFIVALGLAAISGAQILLGMLLAEDAYKLRSLGNEERSLTNEAQIVVEEVAALGSPQNLADAAHSLGMVVNSAPVMLDISTDRVYGNPEPVSAADARVASANLVPNSVMGSATEFSQAVAAGAIDEAQEFSGQTSTSTDLFTADLIPASPTS